MICTQKGTSVHKNIKSQEEVPQHNSLSSTILILLKNIPLDVLISIIELIFINFRRNDKFYKIFGCLMGSPLSPINTLSQWEEGVINIHSR